MFEPLILKKICTLFNIIPKNIKKITFRYRGVHIPECCAVLGRAVTELHHIEVLQHRDQTYSISLSQITAEFNIG